MRHGYTNLTSRVGEVVQKVYAGPEASGRALTEQNVLKRLSGTFPVPVVLTADSESLTMGYIEGRHGQDLIDTGHAEQVLAACGRVLRQLHSIATEPNGEVIVHGDFGPNNVLFDRQNFTVVAVVDWEFSSIGKPVQDLAWCEWIVQMHHPAALPAIDAFYQAYGEKPPWSERQATMLARCQWLETFCRRWDDTGVGIDLWRHRAQITQTWLETSVAQE